MNNRLHKLNGPKKDHAGVSRRTFLLTSAVAGLTSGTALSTAGKAFAASLNQYQAIALLQVVQDIFPHPQLLPISVYQGVINGLMSEADGAEETATLLTEGLEDLNVRSNDMYGVAFADVDAYEKREGLLRIIQDDPFFQKLRWATWAAIYNNPEAWPLFGYEGSSWEHGGYLDRGFSDATWIPPGPTLEERMKAVSN